ncbi:ribbon-helix-helix domain-containing protein [Saccharolobus islandicus]|uniref:CopG n=1 Tax=Saccharolobus islandicus TaxID=43080 RepID=O05476_SACIS|nr:hypothetical protein [Sulfolobus islandicus]AAB51530.1 CopG [Sulfolobus islandicus]
MVSTKPNVHIRLREEERKLLKEIAQKYDISESDVVKIALKKLARELGMDNSP